MMTLNETQIMKTFIDAALQNNMSLSEYLEFLQNRNVSDVKPSNRERLCDKELHKWQGLPYKSQPGPVVIATFIKQELTSYVTFSVNDTRITFSLEQLQKLVDDVLDNKNLGFLGTAISTKGQLEMNFSKGHVWFTTRRRPVTALLFHEIVTTLEKCKQTIVP